MKGLEKDADMQEPVYKPISALRSRGPGQGRIS
jgi:hypothetical protein